MNPQGVLNFEKVAGGPKGAACPLFGSDTYRAIDCQTSLQPDTEDRLVQTIKLVYQRCTGSDRPAPQPPASTGQYPYAVDKYSFHHPRVPVDTIRVGSAYIPGVPQIGGDVPAGPVRPKRQVRFQVPGQATETTKTLLN